MPFPWDLAVGFMIQILGLLLEAILRNSSQNPGYSMGIWNVSGAKLYLKIVKTVLSCLFIFSFAFKTTLILFQITIKIIFSTNLGEK